MLAASYHYCSEPLKLTHGEGAKLAEDKNAERHVSERSKVDMFDINVYLVYNYVANKNGYFTKERKINRCPIKVNVSLKSCYELSIKYQS